MTRAAEGKRSLRLASVSREQEQALIVRELSALGGSLPVLHALEVLREQTPNASLGRTLEQVTKDVRKGTYVSDSLRKHPRWFPEFFVAMVSCSEVSGGVASTLDMLAEHLERQVDLESRFRRSITRPVRFIVAIVGATSLLLAVAAARYGQGVVSGALPASGLGAVSTGLASVSTAIFVGAAVAVGLWLALRLAVHRSRWVRRRVDALLLRTPVLGPLATTLSNAGFCRSLGTLTSAGVPILGALELSSVSLRNQVFSDAVQDAMESVRRGEDLEESLERSGIFTRAITRLIGTSEHARSIGSILEPIAVAYENRAREAMKCCHRRIRIANALLSGLLLLAGFAAILMLVLV